MSKILIVEDDMAQLKELQLLLNNIGYKELFFATNYQKAIDIIKKNSLNLILLDIELKGIKNGIEIAKIIDLKYNIPYIFLTSHTSIDIIEKVATTEYKTFLNKPFNKNSLLSNIKLILKKDNSLNKFITLKNYTYDTLNKIIYLNSTPIKLTLKERTLLEIFINNANRVVSKTLIEDRVWIDKKPDSKSSIRTLIFNLRQKLPYLDIETISAVGYRLNCSIS